jgi:hypothetical protein
MFIINMINVLSSQRIWRNLRKYFFIGRAAISVRMMDILNRHIMIFLKPSKLE